VTCSRASQANANASTVIRRDAQRRGRCDRARGALLAEHAHQRRIERAAPLHTSTAGATCCAIACPIEAAVRRVNVACTSRGASSRCASLCDSHCRLNSSAPCS